MSEVTIYTQDQCPPCQFVKQYFTEKEIQFTEKNIKNKQFKNELIDLDSFSTPTVLINGEVFYQVDIESFNKALGIH
ncbi:glutaredoxin domain-containing protein [Mammaliicoccus sciuri]|uniref:glutaredoxin domain-containing protein n=2 Tax=Mammaliicoccus sciuri TaxID=1296 RepID=UPI000CD31A38|nr:glutaredoxin domain-containing protein [Mammaliicoccus sciuri]MCD8808713.1 glutaredoxin family protein [Mammaliicoccus sciuri]MCD8894935.1 glutaredoxin family protein [Mammaliicoccus sciuri]MCD8913314.1 glutaredoxin family protein [Mammaliicoccus sciuri]MEB7065759.1 glutaredoxin family protein [Mammaliicoccus sciuri]PNZ24763.1 NrdH-redoxin [Mammaliicoccus sciuri]